MKKHWKCLFMIAFCMSVVYFSTDKIVSTKYDSKISKAQCILDSVNKRADSLLLVNQMKEDVLVTQVNVALDQLNKQDNYINEILKKKHDEKVDNYVKLPITERFGVFANWLSKKDSL